MTANSNTQPWHYKYAEELKRLKDCPPKKLQSQIKIGYRFAFADINHPHNYLPAALIKPSRVLPNQVAIVDCCTAFSLSMYESFQTIQKKVTSALKSNPQFLKRVGNHFVEIRLDPSSGQHTQPNNDGHFEFFETSTFDCKTAVSGHVRI